MKDFHIGDILSITIDKLVSPKGMQGVYDILQYMSGSEISTHQIPRVIEECKSCLLNQYPNLKDVCTKELQSKGWKVWLDKQIKRFGEKLPVMPLPKGAHQKIDPVIEAEFRYQAVKKKH